MKKLFIDIETATLLQPEEFKKSNLYDIWVDRIAKWEEPIELYKTKWPIYAEYSQIVCVSICVDEEWLKIKSLYQKEKYNEKDLLTDLKEILDHPNISNRTMVWHNLIGFDVPFLVKRFIVNWIELPKILRVWRQKPREVNMEDTLVMWKSTWVMWAWLWLLCELFRIDNPKSDIDWSDVSESFHKWEYDRIAKYCEADVKATYEVYMIMINMWINFN